MGMGLFCLFFISSVPPSEALVDFLYEEDKWIYSYEDIYLQDGEYTDNILFTGEKYVLQINGERQYYKTEPTQYNYVKTPPKKAYNVYESNYKEEIPSQEYELIKNGKQPESKQIVSLISKARAITTGDTSLATVNPATSLTFSHDGGTGNDRILILNSVSNASVTSITFNGVATTLSINTVAQCCHVNTYYQFEGQTGTANVVINISASSSIRGVATTYTDVSGIGDTDETSGTADPVSLTLTFGASSYIHDNIGVASNPTIGAGQTLIADHGGAEGIYQGSSYDTVNGVVSWSGTSGGYDYQAIELLNGSTDLPIERGSSDSFEDLNSGSSILYHGFLILFTGFIFPVWYFKRKNEKGILPR